jgi:hypothetical protein
MTLQKIVQNFLHTWIHCMMTIESTCNNYESKVPNYSELLTHKSFLQWANLIGPSHKKVETMGAPKSRRFFWKIQSLPLWPTYIGVKERTFGKTHGIKARCYWEHPWGTQWELGNILGTRWEPIGDLKGTKEKWKIPPPTPPPKLKRKKFKALWGHVEPSHWRHEISISKIVHHHFWPGLIPPLETGGTCFILLNSEGCVPTIN